MMKRLLSILLTVAVAGCASRDVVVDVMPMGEMNPEMANLEGMIGTWEGEAQMISIPAAMREMMPDLPEGELPPPTKGGGTNTWALGGTYLKAEGWHETMPGEKEHYVEYFTWDPVAKKYRQWWFGSNGDWGEGTMTIDDKGVMYTSFRGVNGEGQPTSGHGTLRFVEPDTMEWEWSGNMGAGVVEMRGTSRRQ